MHAGLAASMCLVAMAGLAAAGTVTPVVGTTLLAVPFGGCGEPDAHMSAPRKGLGEPTQVLSRALHPTEVFQVDVPAGAFEVRVESHDTRVRWLEDDAWKERIVISGCETEAHRETFAARGFGSASVAVWALGPP